MQAQLRIPLAGPNTLSPDQRCWTPHKAQKWRSALSRGHLRGNTLCPCPAELCPPLVTMDVFEKKLVAWPSYTDVQPTAPRSSRPAPQPSAPRCTLDDLKMPHSHSDALEIVQQKRRQSEIFRQTLASDGAEISRVSQYSRRRFDSALQSQGNNVPPLPEESNLFFVPVQPSWSVSARSKSRPHTAQVQSYLQLSAHGSASTAAKKRPDSEPPHGTARLSLQNGSGAAPELNHIRWPRNKYPEINRLVQHYNTQLRVVCGKDGRPCERQRREGCKDVSVNNEVYLVPVDLETHEESEEMPEDPENTPPSPPRSSHEAEDGHLSNPEQHGGSQVSDEDLDSVEGPRYCWVDDATVTSELPENMLVPGETGSIETVGTNHAADPTPSDFVVSHSEAQVRPTSAASHPSAAGNPSQSPITNNPAQTAPSQKNAVRKKSSHRNSGNRASLISRKKNTASQIIDDIEVPPVPVEDNKVEQEKNTEEEIDEVDKSEEPPIPVPPPYICPSDVSRSHKAEIRRWLNKQPFHAAARVTPYFK